MSMSVSIPPELQPFIERELATGKFRDEQDLVAKALMLYVELQERHETLRTRVQRSLEQADHGQVSELDIESIKSRLCAELDEFGQPK
jgi:Arc/MetJ-type ribon-helix-helix transcriptional regulator